jgi:hypothetical protein
LLATLRSVPARATSEFRRYGSGATTAIASAVSRIHQNAVRVRQVGAQSLGAVAVSPTSALRPSIPDPVRREVPPTPSGAQEL